MISVIIPSLNAESRLAACLEALVSATVDGLVREVIVVDGGSADRSVEIADGFGAKILTSAPGRGMQLSKGADAAKGGWLLFLHADTVLEEGWDKEVRTLIEKGTHDAGVFTLAFTPKNWKAQLVALGAMKRTTWLGLPYGDQGLLILRTVYDEIGGYTQMPLFEDVDIMDRLRRIKNPYTLHMFDAKAFTSAARYEAQGYFRRVVKNFILLLRYRCGASAEQLARDYK